MTQNSLHAAMVTAPVGKRTPATIYVHRSAVDLLPMALYKVVEKAWAKLEDQHPEAEWTVTKVQAIASRWVASIVSFLDYPEFDQDPHPALATAYTLNLLKGKKKFFVRSYPNNPPILHRKELFVPEQYPNRIKWAALTKMEEDAGLLGSSQIGFKKQWEELLSARGLKIEDYKLVEQTFKPDQ